MNTFPYADVVDSTVVTRAAVPSLHPTSFLSVDAGKRALIDVAATGPRSGSGADAGEKLPVLLVPGFTGSKEDFSPILDPLAAAGHRVLALDLAGQWESGPGAEPDDPAAYLPEALARDLPQVLTALGIGRAHLLGHSYGGLVAQAAVLADPSPWASVTLLCSGPGALTGQRRSSTDLLRQAAAGMTLPDLYDVMLQFWASKGEASPPAETLAFQRARFAAGPAAGIIGIANGLLEEPDRIDALLRVTTAAGLPVSVVYGELDDAWLPSEQDDMAARLGTAPIVITGAGHSPAYEAPAALVDVLVSFWGKS